MSLFMFMATLSTLLLTQQDHYVAVICGVGGHKLSVRMISGSRDSRAFSNRMSELGATLCLIKDNKFMTWVQGWLLEIPISP